MPEALLTFNELAELLKVAERTIYTMGQRRELPAFKVGGHWHFKQADLDPCIADREATARNEGARG